jgi:hypothetical protein
VGEFGHRGESDPVRHALGPREGVCVDLAGLVAALDLGRGHRADLLAIHDHVPDGVGSRLDATAGVGRSRRDARRILVGLAAGGRSVALRANHDGVRALLAADLEDLVADLVVADLVLRAAIVADDSHLQVSPRRPLAVFRVESRAASVDARKRQGKMPLPSPASTAHEGMIRTLRENDQFGGEIEIENEGGGASGTGAPDAWRGSAEGGVLGRRAELGQEVPLQLQQALELAF